MSIGVTSSGPAVETEGRTTGWWGMVMFMVTEGMVFGLLLFAYFYFAAHNPEWPPRAFPEPELRVSFIRSLLLFASSATMIVAERGIERNRTDRLAIWTAITFALAAAFFIGHWQEQFKLLAELAPGESAYGTVFITIVNFHAFHLLVGMGMLAFVFVGAIAGRFSDQRHEIVRNVGMYWHYVDAIWVVVYGSLYVSPHLIG